MPTMMPTVVPVWLPEEEASRRQRRPAAGKKSASWAWLVIEVVVVDSLRRYIQSEYWGDVLAQKRSGFWMVTIMMECEGYEAM